MTDTTPRSLPHRLAAFAALPVFILAGAGCRPEPPIGSPPPPNYFVASEATQPTVVACDLRGERDRFKLDEIWDEELPPCSLGRGWTHPDLNGVMAMGLKPWFEVVLPDGGWTHLLFSIRAYESPAAGPRQTMTVQLNDETIGTVEVPRGWTTVQLSIPEGLARPGVNRIATSFGYRAAAASGRDSRVFSAHLRQVAVVRHDRAELGNAEAAAIVRRPTVKLDRSRFAYNHNSGWFEILDSGTLGMLLELPTNASTLEGSVILPPFEGERPEVQLRIQSLSSADTVGPIPYDARFLSPRTGVLKADVAAMAGHRVLAMIEVDKKTSDGAVLVAPPQLGGRQARKGPPRATASTRPTSATPDIIVITLDAARPDRFSSYGYERETTPNIDRLAEEALVFRNAFALAPYTSCSVPTMVTGLSFLDHQVVRRGDRLSEEVTTLAEYLKNAGYRSACISATPNNSRSLGTHQGYDDFIETWHVVPRRESIDAALLSQMALDWLEENDTGAPIHLQLHYVPPHGPYTPDEEFDLFTDPAYDGPFDGSNHVIAAVDSHRWWARPQDLAHMNALYDGNLREADAAVERVLEALRARPRWRDTVVLVTSDHGEAFFEHDRMGHNSTLFDEMLRVPFILRLPAGAAAMHSIDLDRLVTLADIVPTLVGLAGMKAVPEAVGVDLLRPLPADTSILGRHLVARTATVPPVYAIRNLHRKLILSTSGQGALFDLVRDPGERNDLVLIDRPSLVGLGMLLTGELARAASFEPAPELDELPEQDVEMLKALGYLQ